MLAIFFCGDAFRMSNVSVSKKVGRVLYTYSCLQVSSLQPYLDDIITPGYVEQCMPKRVFCSGLGS